MLQVRKYSSHTNRCPYRQVLPSAPSVDNVATDDTVDAAENTNGFNITGTGENGSTISLEFSSGHTLSGGNTATVSGGTWSIAVAAQEAGNYFKAGEELITVTQTDAAGNVSTSTKKLIDVNTTHVTGGTLGDLSQYSKVELNANSTLPDATNKLPSTLDVKAYTLTANADIDLTGVSLSNLGDLAVSAGVTVTMSASQANSFNSGTITLTGDGAIAVTAGGDLSSYNLASVDLTLTADTTLPNTNSALPDTINAGSNDLTVAASLDIYQNFINPGTTCLWRNADRFYCTS